VTPIGVPAEHLPGGNACCYGQFGSACTVRITPFPGYDAAKPTPDRMQAPVTALNVPE
jgi:hypothetical protein